MAHLFNQYYDQLYEKLQQENGRVLNVTFHKKSNTYITKKLDPTDINDVNEAGSEPSIHIVDFEPKSFGTTPYQKAFDVDQKTLNDELLKANMKFPLRVYVPPANFYNEKPLDFRHKDLLILINGFGEANVSLFDHLGLSLAREGVPCILFPLPFHFVRNRRFPTNSDTHDPYVLGRLLRSVFPQLIFQNFYMAPKLLNVAARNINEDIREFIDLNIQGINRDKNYWEFLFHSETKVSLLGHSLGGLVAKYLLFTNSDCAHEVNGEKKITNMAIQIHKAILLESGASLDSIDTNQLLVRDEFRCRLIHSFYFTSNTNGSITEEEYLRQHSVSDLGQFFNPQFEERRHAILDNYLINESDSDPSKGYTKKQIDYEKFMNNLSRFKKNSRDDIYDEMTALSLQPDDYTRLVNMQEHRLKEEIAYILLNRSLSEANRLWNCLLKELYKDATHGSETNSFELKILKQVFYGNETLYKKEVLQKLSKDLLFIIGGADDIFPLASILGISPSQGLAIVQVPSLTHFLKSSKEGSEWDYWKQFLSDVIISFHKKTSTNQN